MANPNAPFGLRPVRHLFGGVVRPNEYTIADQYGTSLFLGDPVLATGTGKDIGIAAAATNGKLTGVFQGCEFLNTLGDTIWSERWPAGQVTDTRQTVKAFVIDDPFVLFEVQFDTLAAADIRALTNLVAGAGNTKTNLSGWTAVAPPGGGQNQLKVYGLSGVTSQGGAVNAYGAFAVGQVLLAQHEMAGNMAGL
jgi:hypothetical protein